MFDVDLISGAVGESNADNTIRAAKLSSASLVIGSDAARSLSAISIS